MIYSHLIELNLHLGTEFSKSKQGYILLMVLKTCLPSKSWIGMLGSVLKIYHASKDKNSSVLKSLRRRQMIELLCYYIILIIIQK